MKPVFKNSRFSNALLLSILLHLIFGLIWGITHIRRHVEKIEPFIHVEITKVTPKPSLRPRTRPLYVQRVSNLTQPVLQHATSEAPVAVREISPDMPKLDRRLSDPKAIAMVNDTGIPLTATSDVVGEMGSLPVGPKIYNGLTSSGTGSPLSRRVGTPGRSLNIERPPAPPPELAGLTRADLALIKIARHILSSRHGDRIDIVFVIDASQSMRNDIEAVRDHLSQMTDLLESEKLDFTVGVVAFRDHTAFSLMGWDFQITAQTTSIESIKKVLSRIKCRGGEKALNALIKAASEVQFRQNSERRFILVTDEYVSGGYSGKEVLAKLKAEGISVDVIGRDEQFQRVVAEQTRGLWLPISSLKD